jgi:hypothetical protein
MYLLRREEQREVELQTESASSRNGGGETREG